MVGILKTTVAPWHPWSEWQSAVESVFAGENLTTYEAQEWDGRFEGRVLVSLADEWDRPLADKAAHGLLDWVEDGGGLLVLHHGISLQARPDLAALIGGRFVGHPPAGPLTFRMASSVPTWRMTDEPYQFELAGPVEPLLEYEHEGRWQLGGWRRSQGKGRVIYLMPGHFPENFAEPNYLALIRACWSSLKTG